MPSGVREGQPAEEASDPAALFLSDCLSLGFGTTEERVPKEEGGKKGKEARQIFTLSLPPQQLDLR